MKSTKLNKYLFPISLALCLLALTPREARALSKVCAPDNRGCVITKMACKDVYLPSRWTCNKALALTPQAGDGLVRDKDGRGAAVVGGVKMYLLSDALEAQLVRNRPSAEEFARLVSKDRGPVAEASILQLSKELGLPVAK